MLIKRFLYNVLTLLVLFSSMILANEPIHISHAAVKATATNNGQCNRLTIFYGELGDKNGILASGWGGKKALTDSNSLQAKGIGVQSAMRIASASKWLFAAYALEREGYASISQQFLTIDGNKIAKRSFFNFTSGYDNERRRLCKSHRVSDCITRKGERLIPAALITILTMAAICKLCCSRPRRLSR